MAEPAGRRLRVLFYVEGLDIGGANQSTVTTALALKRRGHEVFYASQDGPLRGRLEEAGIPHIAIQTRVEHPNLVAGRRLARVIDREGIEVACPNGWDCLMDMLLAAGPRGIPMVPTFPAVYPEYRHPRVPRAIVYSGEYRDALIRTYGWKPESLDLFINRIDTDRFRPGLAGSSYRGLWKLDPSTPVALMACRLDTMKMEGVSFFLDAVPSLVERVPQVRVVLVGDGEFTSQVAARAEALNATHGDGRVLLAGRVLDMELAFAAADVVVGNGARSGLEGFASGKPVVSVGPSGLAGVFEPGNIEDFAYYNFDKGRVYDSTTRRDPEALAGTVADLLGDEERRRELGEFGRQYIVRRLGIEAGLDRLEEIYRSAPRRTRLQRIGDGVEFLRSLISFALFRVRGKARRLLGRGPSRGPRPSQTTTGRSFLQDSSRTFLTSLFGVGVGIIQAAVVARALAPEGKGALASAMLIPQLLGTLVPLGIHWSATYHLGRNTYDRATLGRALFAALILLGGAGVVLSAVAGILFRDNLLQGVPPVAFALAVLTVPTQLALLLMGGLFRGEMRIAEVNRMDAGRTLVMFLCILFSLLALGLGVTGVILSQVVAEALVLILALQRLGEIPQRPLFRWDVFRNLMGFGLKVYSFGILLYLNYRFDLFLVRSMLDLQQTGLYASAVALAEMLWMVPTSMGFVLFPRTARTQGPERDRLTLAVCRNGFWVMLVLCGGLALGRNLVIQVFFGRQFLPAGPALLAILPGILAISVQQVLGTDLAGRGRALWVTLAAGLGFAANVVLNLLWIPRYGIVGASLASTVSYVLVTLVVVLAFLRISGSRARDAFLLRKEDWERVARILGRLKGAAA